MSYRVRDHFGVDTRSFFWAVDMVLSRAFRLSSRTMPSTLALLPYIDMLDHSSTDIPVRYRVEGPDFVMTAAKKLTSEEPVLGYYGPKTSWSLLTLYGFVPSTNIHHTTDVVLDVHRLRSLAVGPDGLFNAIVDLLLLQALLIQDEATLSVKIRLTSRGNGDGNLLAVSRALCIDHQDDIPSRAGLHQYLSKENESCARRLAVSLITEEVNRSRSTELLVSDIALKGEHHERLLAMFVALALQHDQIVLQRCLGSMKTPRM